MTCIYSEGQGVYLRREQPLPDRIYWPPEDHWDNEHDKHKDLEEDYDY